MLYDGPYSCQFCTHVLSRGLCESVCYSMFTCVTAVGSENLLAGLGKCHPGKGRGEGFRVHLAARALQVIILPRLCVRRLKHQPTRPHVIKLSWSTSSVDARGEEHQLRASCYPSRREKLEWDISYIVLQTRDRESSDRCARLKKFTYRTQCV